MGISIRWMCKLTIEFEFHTFIKSVCVSDYSARLESKKFGCLFSIQPSVDWSFQPWIFNVNTLAHTERVSIKCLWLEWIMMMMVMLLMIKHNSFMYTCLWFLAHFNYDINNKHLINLCFASLLSLHHHLLNVKCF